MNTEIYEKMEELKVIPVIVLNDAKNAIPLGDALVGGGLPVAEVTFRTAAAEESIKLLTENFPEMLVGAGTVLNVAQARKALSAGAKFIVSPGLDEELVSFCINNDIPVVPGVQTPSEMMKAVNLGLKYVKFFPAEASGGLKTINAICAAFPGVKVMPTGGVGPANLAQYLSSPKVFCCGGSWMVKSAMIEDGNFDMIKAMTDETVDTVRRL